MKCWRVVFLLCILAFCSGGVRAQTVSLHGRIAEAETNAVIPGARVVARSGLSSWGTVSDSLGVFHLELPTPGTFRLTVDALGYRPYTLHQLEVGASTPSEINIELSPSPIFVDQVVVSASRNRERLLQAPASISVVDASQLAVRTSLSPSDNVKGLPGVDVVNIGLQQSTVVARGFNAALSGRLLTMVDHRIVNLPGLRSNLFQTISSPPEDLERIEVVSGPASAMYGPNSAGGVLHMLTKSPLDEQRSSLTLGGGERSVLLGSFSHAQLLSDRFGFRISGQFMRGSDWEYFDPAEPDSVVRGVPTPNGRVDKTAKISNRRDFTVKRWSADVRADYRWRNDAATVVSAGVSRTSDLELAGTGAVQVLDGQTTYAQLRTTWKQLFAQAYIYQLNTGDSYFLRTGDLQVDKSSMIVGQIQHSFETWHNRQRFIYGFDALLTRPRSESTVYGRNEENDDINELGWYVQSETDLAERWKLVLGGRFDSHNRLESGNVSPRAALMFKPSEAHVVRLTYNQSFESPAAIDLFSDFIAAANIGGLPYNARLRGVPEGGFHFKVRNALGGVDGLFMQSPFTPASFGGPAYYLPAEATFTWSAIVPLLQAQGINLAGIPAPNAAQVATSLHTLNLNTQTFEAVSPQSVRNIAPIQLSRTTTIELGYQGMPSKEVVLRIDVYYENTKNPLGAYVVQTPNVFYDYESLRSYLSAYLPADTAVKYAQTISSLPLGTITPMEGDPADLLVATRSFGDVSFFGGDVAITYAPSPSFSVAANYSFLSKNFFEKTASDYDDISLNAPKHKLGFTGSYSNEALGFTGEIRVRYVDSYFVLSGIGRETIPSCTLADINASYRIPFLPSATLLCSVQNLFDTRHQEYIGAPKIGRLALFRLAYALL